jgi:peptide deformylase
MNNKFIYDTTSSLSTVGASPPEPQFKPYSLVDQNSSILSAKLKDFDFGDPTLDSIDIASRLVETAKYHRVYGIAANQCGLQYRVFVAGSDDNFVAFYNPVIISSDGEVLMQESDLSNMGLLLHVKRPKSIVLQYQDYNGETKLLQFEGLTARIIQQNIDRLNGIDFKSKVSQLNLERARKALNKKIKKFVRTNTMIRETE